MQMNKLGQSELLVSELCLGTMTWGTQNSSAEAFAQIDLSMEHGINIIDTAEMYPVNPISPATQGNSERILGEWVAKSGKRDQVLIATKVSGAGMSHVRDGVPISRATITQAIENSLASLQTDYVDLYQLHWPNRGSYMFRQNWHFDPTKQDKNLFLDHINEVLETCADLRAQGKVREFGLSNESAWGTAQWMRVSEENNLPRMVSIQNEYSLMCRLFDTDLAEACHNEHVGLLSFSPLAAGMLSGKYANGAPPAESRGSLVPGLSGRINDRSLAAANAYVAVAQKYGLDTCQMALAWCRTRPFMASSIFGARASGQLENILASVDVTLSDECLKDIASVHMAHPMPY